MIARRFVFAAMVAAVSMTACTLIVLGSIGDKKDYPVGEPGSSSSGTSSGNSSSGNSSSGASASLPVCSLLRGNNDYQEPGHDSDCARCIQNQCAPNVTIACNDGGRAEDWYQIMKACAQRPYEKYADPDSGSDNSWGCSSYVMDPEPVTGDPGSDEQKKYEATKCIHDKCMPSGAEGELPPCQRCEVFHSKGTEGEVQLLKDDLCGRCFSDNCAATLVECCTSWPMSDYVEYCAYTNKQSNYQLCEQIGDAGVPDAANFHPGHSYDDHDKDCAYTLGKCFIDHCKDSPECQKVANQ